jgi:hypothetical protein
MGWTVLGLEPLSTICSPNMPRKGFEPVFFSHMLDMPATMPIGTRVLVGRVAGMHSICDEDSGSNPLSGMLGEQIMNKGSNSILEST